MRIDWNELWKEVSRQDTEAVTSEYWDERASKFRKKSDDKDVYAEKFYEYMDVRPGETLFDMGCGSGTLAIPFAKKGHEIWAADFSEDMLGCMMKDAEAEGVADRIHPIKLDWNEDWEVRDLPVCDIAFASRSMFFEDLTSSLKKLESVALRKVCLGAWDGPGEGLSSCYCAMGELMSRGARPELRYICYPFKSKTHKSDYMAETGFISWYR